MVLKYLKAKIIKIIRKVKYILVFRFLSITRIFMSKLIMQNVCCRKAEKLMTYDKINYIVICKFKNNYVFIIHFREFVI